MTSQVTSREYAHCVDDGGCPRIPYASGVADRPMVGVSWRDATAYADWITNRTVVVHRLPTDEEWVFAAGDKARDEALPLADPVDPAQAWIARYEAEANRARPFALDPQPIGTFGRNENGLNDIGGNVWEWTNTCFLRMTLEPAGPAGRQYQLRRPRRARRTPDLYDRFHPGSSHGRLRRRRAACQSRLPAGGRRSELAKAAQNDRGSPQVELKSSTGHGAERSASSIEPEGWPKHWPKNLFIDCS